MKTIKLLLIYLIISIIPSYCFPQQLPLIDDIMVQKFYDSNNQNFYWFSSKKNIKRANEWLNIIENSDNIGFTLDKPQLTNIHSTLLFNTMTDSVHFMKIDKQITSIILNYLKDLQQGNIQFNYDEISNHRDTVYIHQLLQSNTRESVSKIVARLKCKDSEYVILQSYLQDSIVKTDSIRYKKVLQAMNYRKYFTIIQESEYIVVNIPAAELKYYKNNVLILQMKTVVGKKKTPTPTIASYITSVITFPYWSVPQSIARKEILPKVQKDIDYLERNNLEVVDAKCIPIEKSDLKWNEFTEKNFPYYFRQSSGNDNAMGVLKFELENPYSIFLHATSNPDVFEQKNRFISHGCIRLEKPIELASELIGNKIDLNELEKGKKNTESTAIILSQKLQTFIIYMPVIVVNSQIIFLDDVYDYYN